MNLSGFHLEVSSNSSWSEKDLNRDESLQTSMKVDFNALVKHVLTNEATAENKQFGRALRDLNSSDQETQWVHDVFE